MGDLPHRDQPQAAVFTQRNHIGLGEGLRRCCRGRVLVHPRQGRRQPLRVDGLEQVIERVHLEGAHGITMMRRNEDNRRRVRQPGKQVEALLMV
jgi:hypothetical protein